MQGTFPTITDVLVLVIAFIWIFSVIGVGELLRRRGGFPPTVTRKVIHLGAGLAIFTIPFYTHAWTAIIVVVTVVILLFLASPKSPVKSLKSMFEVMAREEDYLSGHIWGPLLYSISILILTCIFTLIPTLTQFFIFPAMALVAMYFGDGIAPLFGAKFGKHRYTVGNSTRSVEGSIALFIAAFLGTWLCWIFLDVLATGGVPLFNTIQIAILGLICAFSATVIEAVSPAGSDNISVPLLTALILFISALIIYPSMLGMILTP